MGKIGLCRGDAVSQLIVKLPIEHLCCSLVAEDADAYDLLPLLVEEIIHRDILYTRAL